MSEVSMASTGMRQSVGDLRSGFPIVQSVKGSSGGQALSGPPQGALVHLWLFPQACLMRLAPTLSKAAPTKQLTLR